MVFYHQQPNLSLYDIIEALSGQAGIRQQQPQQQQQQSEGRTSGYDDYGQSRLQSIPGYPFVSPTPSYSGYYYTMPSRGSYYEPTYFVNEQSIPSRGYARQSQASHSTPHGPAMARDPIYGLLNLLQGAASSFHDSGSDSGRDEEDDGDRVADTNYGKEGLGSSNKTPNVVEDVQEGEGEDGTPEKAKFQANDAVASQKFNAESERVGNPFLKRKSSTSFVYPNVPSPIPDPLQVSKPEIRLDLPFSPQVNVYDAEKEYIVVLALPGANSKSFSIDYHPSSHELLIKGNVENNLDVDSKLLKISELKYGAFERSVKFPALPKITDEEIKATYSNGLLQIKVPKILNDSSKPKPKRRIIIEDVPDEELEFEKNPNPVSAPNVE
ncbi:heat shock protein HSP42 Ecym_4205 [Eremothecium cymbalariae DBVPG|uniref:SHSP domain-containing protein n=1 Tax=Eremothecium cymbalariae (strain CBS 270.75 / DBVPG 7215 / KCTC 17166 / NRRL Y-17582) TaxID=931890 RepID=G8JTB9_ERECY|nr:hypothetical protein Ecym_4205 [Eremothecium cymbalariae DBVPG\